MDQAVALLNSSTKENESKLDTCDEKVNRLITFQEYALKEIEEFRNKGQNGATQVTEDRSYLGAARGGRGPRGGRGRGSGRGRGQGRKITFAPAGWGDEDSPSPNEDVSEYNHESTMEVDEDQERSPKEPPPLNYRRSKKKNVNTKEQVIDFDSAFEHNSPEFKPPVDSPSSIVTISMKFQRGYSPRSITTEFKKYQDKHELTKLIQAVDSYSQAGITIMELITKDTDKAALLDKLQTLKVPLIKEKPRFPNDVNSQEFKNVQPSISARLGRLLSRISPAKQSIREAILSNLDTGGVIKEKALAHEQSLRARFQYDRFGRR